MSYMNLGQALLASRARRKHTQEAAAKVVGVSIRTWKTWESEGAIPNAVRLEDLAAYAGLKLRDLVRLVQHDAAGSSHPTDAQGALVQP